LQFGAVGADAHDASAAERNCPAVFPFSFLDAVVPHTDIEPAVDPHADAVCGVVATAVGDLVGGQPGDQDLLPVGNAVAIVVVKEAECRRVHDPHGAVAITDAARVFGSGEDGDLVDLAVVVAVDAAQNLAASGCATERALLIHRDIDGPGRLGSD